MVGRPSSPLKSPDPLLHLYSGHCMCTVSGGARLPLPPLPPLLLLTHTLNEPMTRILHLALHCRLERTGVTLKMALVAALVVVMGDGPAFDGTVRVEEPGRESAFMIPPPCPAGTPCKASSSHCASISVLP